MLFLWHESSQVDRETLGDNLQHLTNVAAQKYFTKLVSGSWKDGKLIEVCYEESKKIFFKVNEEVNMPVHMDIMVELDDQIIV